MEGKRGSKGRVQGEGKASSAAQDQVCGVPVFLATWNDARDFSTPR